MLIDFQSSGGFTGLEYTYRADTEQLPPELVQELSNLIANSGFFEMQPSQVDIDAKTIPGYYLSLSEGNQQKSLRFNEINVPDSLRPLLQRLQALAIEQRLKET